MTTELSLCITLSTMQDYETRHIVRILEINSKTLIDWVEIGLVLPAVRGAEGAGTRRRYSQENLVEFAIIKTLLGDGIKRELVRHALMLAREYARPDPLISIPVGMENPFSLSTEIEEFASYYLLFDLTTGVMQFGLVRKTGVTHSIKIGQEGKELASAEETLAALGKDMLALGRGYLLNLSKLKADLRRRMEQ